MGFGRWLTVGLLLVAGCDDHIFPTGTAEVPSEGYPGTWDGMLTIFEEQCSNCHAPPESVTVFDLAADLEAQAQEGTNEYVVPGDPQSSVLYLSVSFDPAAQPMPVGAVEPIAEVVEAVEEWILDGAPIPGIR